MNFLFSLANCEGKDCSTCPIRILSVGVVLYVRSSYMKLIGKLFPQLDEGSMWPAMLVGVLLFAGVSVFNVIAVRRKVASIWMHKS